MHEMARYDILEVPGHGEKEKSKANINQPSEVRITSEPKTKKTNHLHQASHKQAHTLFLRNDFLAPEVVLLALAAIGHQESKSSTLCPA